LRGWVGDVRPTTCDLRVDSRPDEEVIGWFLGPGWLEPVVVGPCGPHVSSGVLVDLTLSGGDKCGGSWHSFTVCWSGRDDL